MNIAQVVNQMQICVCLLAHVLYFIPTTRRHIKCTSGIYLLVIFSSIAHEHEYHSAAAYHQNMYNASEHISFIDRDGLQCSVHRANAEGRKVGK